ncbi:hypothetical protein V8G54_029703 [Vigna mungo]|uniref:Uncharacterized protein n=1 Tax=Vigna mungo TaxID=3915 RepID=A0AAQ3MUS9_VIGMU
MPEVFVCCRRWIRDQNTSILVTCLFASTIKRAHSLFFFLSILAFNIFSPKPRIMSMISRNIPCTSQSISISIWPGGLMSSTIMGHSIVSCPTSYAHVMPQFLLSATPLSFRTTSFSCSISFGSFGSRSLSEYLRTLCKKSIYLMVRSNKESMLHFPPFGMIPLNSLIQSWIC